MDDEWTRVDTFDSGFPLQIRNPISEHIKFAGAYNSLRAVTRAQLGEDIADVAFDGINCDDELPGNLLVGGATCQQAQHLQFAHAQGVEQWLLR